ncbi:hypothetical protein HAX54_028029 [Datura stramonium]|uniref:Pectinesterase inhibitor domain-containing protein n=1 Tax=Datura stramonium TaxID=4076 RepID=A0ABS8V3G7_DATST|nr:hypothetical protein [Datura stramonium]
MANNVIVGGIASILVVACVVAACVTLAKHGDSLHQVKFTTSIIRRIMCQPTPYKRNLMRRLVRGEECDGAKDYIKVALKRLKMLSAAEEICLACVEDLRGSVSKLDNFDYTKIKDVVDDLKTWLSAVVAYEETCLDALAIRTK